MKGTERTGVAVLGIRSSSVSTPGSDSNCRPGNANTGSLVESPISTCESGRPEQDPRLGEERTILGSPSSSGSGDLVLILGANWVGEVCHNRSTMSMKNWRWRWTTTVESDSEGCATNDTVIQTKAIHDPPLNAIPRRLERRHVRGQ